MGEISWMKIYEGPVVTAQEQLCDSEPKVFLSFSGHARVSQPLVPGTAIASSLFVRWKVIRLACCAALQVINIGVASLQHLLHSHQSVIVTIPIKIEHSCVLPSAYCE